MFIFASPFVAAQYRKSHCSDQFKRMANAVCEISVTQAPLAAPASDVAGAGAVVDFWGVVRLIEDGREIEGIDYDAYREMAEHQLKRIAEQAAERFGLRFVIVHHRIGFVAVGEPSLFLRVASPHRGEGFRASQWIVDELKRKVPIWKRARFRAVAGIADAETCSDDSKRATGKPGSATPATV
jgi:molybdopterin synthase catalytic subunit